MNQNIILFSLNLKKELTKPFKVDAKNEEIEIVIQLSGKSLNLTGLDLNTLNPTVDKSIPLASELRTLTKKETNQIPGNKS